MSKPRPLPDPRGGLFGARRGPIMGATESKAGMSVAEEADIDAYFERTGFAGSIAPTQETLTQLLAQHLNTIAFETLDPARGAPVRLALRDLEQKMIHEKRGGHGLEHNLLFGAVLEALFFEVTRVAALEPDRDPCHLALVVSSDGVSYFVDAGLGALGPSAALKLRSGAETEFLGRRHRLTEEDGTWTFATSTGDSDEWRELYHFRINPLASDVLSSMNDRAADRYRDHLKVSRRGAGRLLAIDGARFTIDDAEGQKELRDIASAAEMRLVLTQNFNIVAPPDPRLDEAFERTIAAAASA